MAVTIAGSSPTEAASATQAEVDALNRANEQPAPPLPLPAPIPNYKPASPGTEIAEIVVEDNVLGDWESVYVQHRWRQAWPIFRFVTSERDDRTSDRGKYWPLLRVQPLQRCLVTLGGQIAITGVITIRQTAYDANSHSVSFQGMGMQWFTWRGAIVSETQTFKGGYVDVAKQVMADFKVVPKVLGIIDPMAFDPPAHSETGDTVFQFLENLGKVRDVVLGADHEGNLLLIGKHGAQIVETLVEGDNIISCQCVINFNDAFSKYGARTQASRSDDSSPQQAGHLEAWVNSAFMKIYSPQLTPLEHPVKTQHEVDLRAETEQKWSDGTVIEATVVVYGWFTRSGLLWCYTTGQSVMLNSPMTGMVPQEMSIQQVTCTQDRQSGTRTTLTLVAPWYLNTEPGLAAKNFPKELEGIIPNPNKAYSNPNAPATNGAPDKPNTTPDTKPGDATQEQLRWFKGTRPSRR